MNIEQTIIESTYFHKATVQRHGDFEDEYGETKPGVAVLYEDIDCAVSQNSGWNARQTDPRNIVEYNTKLFCSPAYLILPGDIITAVFENGLVRKYKAGESIPYPYHQEVPLLREDEA
ncbi:ABC transporter ATP-binding protein [Sporosarcina sp. P17b]|uniref:ABC transporter ATP-binding protein n=1 Tax=Sporosarcina sp. P17b TaxID=2048260 RepID=UPI000C163D09|nr:ABC transporter ATP-binding protein [Sporosarcina sp. P17b]PIC72427.1 ABC transporter ATP-binding protein [Sporosarcina sp. P17b]